MLSPRDNLISLISDLYKDLHGFRPRGLYNWGGMDIDDLGEEADYLEHLLRQHMEATEQERIEEDRHWREEIALGVIPLLQRFSLSLGKCGSPAPKLLGMPLDILLTINLLTFYLAYEIMYTSSSIGAT